MTMKFVGGILALLSTSVASFSSDLTDYNQNIKRCRPGEILENDCTKCICSEKEIFQCTLKKCNTIELTTTCRPNTVFELDDNICICDENGYWQNQDCSNLFQNLQDPVTCKPNSYINIECNVCRCTAEGKVDKNRCTENPCNDTRNNQRRAFRNKVFGSCKEKYWYSLAPCQFCYCVNKNKLVCNTGNNDFKKLDLGSYNLNVCGKDLPKEVFDLLPEGKALRYSKEAGNKTNSKIPKKKIEKHSNKNKKKSKDEDYSESVQEEAIKVINLPTKEIARNKPITVSPLEIISSESIETITDVLSESSNEIPVETETHKQAKVTTDKPFNFNDLNLSIPMKFDLPFVLDKVLQMALRKSMITIQKNTECEAGSTIKLKCNNVCICTNDKKLLCTKNPC